MICCEVLESRSAGSPALPREGPLMVGRDRSQPAPCPLHLVSAVFIRQCTAEAQKDLAQWPGHSHARLFCLHQTRPELHPSPPATHRSASLHAVPHLRGQAARPSAAGRARTLPRLPLQCARSHFSFRNSLSAQCLFSPPLSPWNREGWLLWQWAGSVEGTSSVN